MARNRFVKFLKLKKKTNKIFRFHDCDFAPVMYLHPLSLNAVWLAMLAWPRGEPKVSVFHFVKREVTPLS